MTPQIRPPAIFRIHQQADGSLGRGRSQRRSLSSCTRRPCCCHPSATVSHFFMESVPKCVHACLPRQDQKDDGVSKRHHASGRRANVFLLHRHNGTHLQRRRCSFRRNGGDPSDTTQQGTQNWERRQLSPTVSSTSDSDWLDFFVTRCILEKQ